MKAASEGFSHSLALTNDGLYAWRDNHNGQLGDGTFVSHSTPAKVIFPPAVTTVSAIAAGRIHSLAVTNDGLYAWGYNAAGQLGIGIIVDYKLTPDQGPGGGQRHQVAAEEYHSDALHWANVLARPTPLSSLPCVWM